jgi:dihydrolipoamide dehydrogenase
MEKKYDLGIIGGGPAGYSAAIRAAQKGLKVVLFEKDCLGGVCLNRGCIPTKTILHCADFYKSLKKAEKFGVSFGENAALSADYQKVFNRKNEIVSKIQKSLTKLVQSYGVTIVNETALIADTNIIHAGGMAYSCKNIILATGSKPSQINGLECDGKFILNSNDVLCLESLPENILVVGSGAIGVEWARIFSGFNKAVTVVDLASKLLPQADTDVSKKAGAFV